MTAENPDKKEITAPDYIRTNFDPSDRLAVVVRNRRRGDTLQRISTAVRIAAPQFQDWLRYKNERDGSDIYLGMNPLKPEAHTRTKDDIQAIKHLYIDLDHDGSKSLAAIQQSDLVPTPSYVLSTSPDKFQVIWKVEGVTQEQAEAFLHALAREFDGDPAATDSTRVLRLPGFANKKYEEDFQVTVQAHADRTYHERDFRLRTDPVDSGPGRWNPSRERTTASGPRELSQSERDWAYAKRALARGLPSEEVIRDIAEFRAHEKYDPEDYARRTVTKAQAELNAQASSRSAGTAPENEGNREPSH
jgi:RepB DNA-primase N-terminal domain/RepB DNA-primase C-terminal helical domain